MPPHPRDNQGPGPVRLERVQEAIEDALKVSLPELYAAPARRVVGAVAVLEVLSAFRLLAPDVQQWGPWARTPSRIAADNGWKVGQPPPPPCCSSHGRGCEQGDECCWSCSEVRHFMPGHGGTICSSPDLRVGAPGRPEWHPV